MIGCIERWTLTLETAVRISPPGFSYPSVNQVVFGLWAVVAAQTNDTIRKCSYGLFWKAMTKMTHLVVEV